MNPDNAGPIIVLIIIFLTGGICGYHLHWLRNRRRMEKIHKQQRDDHQCLMAVVDNLTSQKEGAES